MAGKGYHGYLTRVQAAEKTLLFPWQARITWLASSSFPVPCNILKCRSFCPNYRGKSVLENCPLLIYSRLQVTRTLSNSNLPLTRSIFISLRIVFYIILPSITRTPDNSNCFLFPLKVRIIGSRLYNRLPVTRTR